MGTIDTLLRVKADASQAVRGLQPLQTSLQETATDAQKTETALADLAGQHTISLNNQAIESARLEIERLRAIMREQLRLDPQADTRDAQRKIAQLQRSVKTLDATDATVDVAVNADATGLLALRSALTGVSEGFVQGAGGGMIGRLVTSRAAVGALGAEGAAAATGIGALAIAGSLAATEAWKLGQAAADVQTQVAQLNALTGGMGVETFQQLNEFASKTPFALDEVTSATKRLVAAGVDLNQIPKQLNDIGNVAAATGVPLEQIATVFAQMESKGKLTFEETQQLAEAGIPVWSTLADKLGLTVAQVQKLATEGKLGADAIDLLRVSLGEQFPTAMTEQAATFNGQMSTLNDTVHTTEATLGTLFLPTMQELIRQMQALATMTAGAVDWLADMDGKLRDITHNSAGLINVLGVLPGMNGMVNALGTSQGDAADATADHKSATDDLVASIRAEMSAATDAQAILQAHTDQMKTLDDKVSSTADHYRELVDNFEAFNGAVIDSRSTVFDYQAAIDTLSESLAKSGSFSPDVEAGRTNWDNLVGFAETASDRVEDTWKTKGKGAAVALQASFRQSLHQMLLDAGVNSDQAWALVDQVLKKPHQITMEIGEIDDAKLKSRLAKLRRERAEIKTGFVMPEGAGGFEAQLILDEQSRKLKPINAKIHATLDKLQPEKDKLDEAANPDGKPRKAAFEAKVEPKSLVEAEAELDGFITLRRSHVKIYIDVVPPTGFPGPVGGPTAGPSSLVAAGPAMLTSPAPTATAGPWTPTLGGGGPHGASGGPTVERLAPRTSPVAVYLDGVEIAHRIEARRALAATASVRRSA